MSNAKFQNEQEEHMRRGFFLICALAAQGVIAAGGDWQTLTTQPGADNRACEMRVPAAWTLKENGASFAGPYTATLIYEAEKPEVWWNQRKKADLKNSRVFQNHKTVYWIEVQGALVSGGDEGAVHIAGMRADNLVCHAVLELKSDAWRENYDAWQKEHGEMIREMMTSLKAK
jgi:hypothetical protein